MTGVLFVGEGGDQALPYYRGRLPAQGLARLGWRSYVKEVLIEGADHRLRGWDRYADPKTITPVVKHIVVRHLEDPLGREHDSEAMYLAARDAGQHVWVDLDDDVWRLPAWNPGARHFTPGKLAELDRNLAVVDGVLCSTAHLAAVVAEHTDTPTFVCPPGIDLAAYRPHGPDRTPLRVGWLGLTKWRGPDLATVGQQIADALRGRDVEFWHLGASPENPPVSRFLPDPFPVPIVERPWVRVADLPRSLAEIDVAVIPMDPTDPVNLSRSETAGLALAAAGVPFAATRGIPAYDKTFPGGSSFEMKLEMCLRAWERGHLRDWGRKIAEHHTPVQIAAHYAAAFASIDRAKVRA